MTMQSLLLQYNNLFAVSCTKLTAPRNGTLDSINHFPGAVVHIICDNGFTITGSSTLVCLDDGQWNNALPSCTYKSSKSTDILDL